MKSKILFTVLARGYNSVVDHDWKWIMYVNRTLDMHMQRQYTIRINAESRDFWAQFSIDHDQSFLLLFKIVTFCSNDIDGSECSDAKQKLQA